MSTRIATELLIRERLPDDDKAIVAIRNEANPDLPPITVERYRFQANPALTPDGGVQDRFVAQRSDPEREPKVIGIYFLGGNWFFERPNTYLASLGVAKSQWGQGIGEQLYQHLLARATRMGATRLYGNVVEGDQHSTGFAERRGFRPNGRIGRMSRLVVAEANVEGSRETLETVESAGIEIRTLSEVGLDDEFLRRLHSVDHEIGKDIPSAEEWKQTPFELWKKWMLDAPGNSPDHVWIAMDGDRPVGLAVLEMRGDSAAFNGLTGVDRAYRRCGIARALKHHQIAWCKQHGVKHIFTTNDVDNTGMLAINIGLGYTPVPSEVEVVKELNAE